MRACATTLLNSRPVEPGARGKRKQGRLRLVLRGVLLLFLLVIAAVGFVVIRGKYFPPTFDVPSIRETATYQQADLLERAWTLPVARTFPRPLLYQSNGSLCGPSSVANIARSFGARATEDSVLDGTGLCWSGLCFLGLSLDEVAQLARATTRGQVELVRDLTYARFREHLPRFNDPARRYLVNFHRGLLFGKGTGHHSPIGGYLQAEDLVFVLDVNGSFEPWVVTPERLFRAIDSVDSATGKKRGLLVVSQRRPARAGTHP